MTQDHYAVLGVAPTAPAAVIRAAYLALMREYHPDRNPSPAAAERAQAIIAAFKVLGDFDSRSQYDWARRRAREAAEAAAARRAPRVSATSIVLAGIGLAAAAGLILMPSPIEPPAPVTAPPRAKVAAVADRKPPAKKVAPAPVPVRAPPVTVAEAAPEHTTRKEPLRVATAEPKPKPVPVARPVPRRMAEPVRMTGAAPVRTDRANPARLARAEPERALPRPVEQPAAVRPVTQRPALVASPTPRLAATRPPARPARRQSGQAQSSGATTDLASLDQFVMHFYGQSWRYGDAPKRAVLEQSRASFVARRGACAAEACKREAYLKLMRDVSAIVETGQPRSR